jgi:hypothetical protein
MIGLLTEMIGNPTPIENKSSCHSKKALCTTTGREIMTSCRQTLLTVRAIRPCNIQPITAPASAPSS